MKKIKPFYLKRVEDETGVSGEGIVALGVVLPSGICIIEWLTFTSSINQYKNIDHVEDVHGHDGKTEIIMGDPPEDAPMTKVEKKTTTKKKVTRKKSK
jgi:hypothetical protein